MLNYISTNANDTKIQVIGSIAGALLGAIIGGLATYWIGEKARTKQIDIDEIKVQRQKVRAHQRAITNANAELSSLLVLTLKNIEHYKDIEKGILDKQGLLRTTISMPQPYSHQAGLMPDILSNSVVPKWLSLESEITLQNSNVNEFNDYYNALRSSAHQILLTGGHLNPQVIAADNNLVTQGANQQITASNSFLDRCFDLLAELELGIEKWKKLNFTNIHLESLEEYIEKLINFKPAEKSLNARIVELKSDYTPEKAFKRA